MHYRPLTTIDRCLACLEWPFLRRREWALAAAIGRVLPGQLRWSRGGPHCPEPLNLKLTPQQAWFGSVYRDAVACARHAGFRFTQAEHGALLAASDAFRINVRRPEEVKILHDITVQGEYRFTIPEPMVVVDIGANVGIASLWFAATHNAPVVAFEPLPPTIQLARQNLALNPLLAERIELRPYGLGASAARFGVEYDPDWLWSASTVSNQLVGASATERATCEIEVRPAAEEIAPILERYPDRQLVLKIDCEGAEYQIVTNLHSGGILSRTKALSLEWHRMAPEHDPHALVRLLQATGFTVFFLSPLTQSQGVLFATK